MGLTVIAMGAFVVFSADSRQTPSEAKKIARRAAGLTLLRLVQRSVGLDGDLLLCRLRCCARAVANGKDVSQLTAQDVMTKGVICCHDTDKVRDILDIMEEKQIRRIPVRDESERVIGLVSLGDISTAVPGKSAAELLQAVAAHHT